MKRSAEKAESSDPKRNNSFAPSSSPIEFSIHVLTRRIGDTSDVESLTNWNEMKLILVPSESTPSVETYICNMNTVQYPEQEVRLAFFFENKSSTHFGFNAKFDGRKMKLRRKVVLSGESLMVHEIGESNYSQNITVRRN